MAQFNALTLTNQGIALLAKAEAGSILRFSTCQMGDGELQTGQSIANLTDMIHRRAKQRVGHDIKVDDGMARFYIGFHLESPRFTQESGFYIREFGVFAKDPDIGDILYAWASAVGTPDFMPFGEQRHAWSFDDVRVPIGSVTAANIRGDFLPYGHHSSSFNP